MALVNVLTIDIKAQKFLILYAKLAYTLIFQDLWEKGG